MSSPTIPVESVFVTEALTVILKETRLAREFGKEYIGVAFDWKQGWPISISYAWSRSAYSGQSQKYPTELWGDMCLAMRLIGRVALHAGLNIIRLSEGVGFSSSRWLITSQEMSDDALRAILERVDEVMCLLDAPLA